MVRRGPYAGPAQGRDAGTGSLSESRLSGLMREASALQHAAVTQQCSVAGSLRCTRYTAAETRAGKRHEDPVRRLSAAWAPSHSFRPKARGARRDARLSVLRGAGRGMPQRVHSARAHKKSNATAASSSWIYPRLEREPHTHTPSFSTLIGKRRPVGWKREPSLPNQMSQIPSYALSNVTKHISGFLGSTNLLSPGR